jgi:SAM-dependent methyltransferase
MLKEYSPAVGQQRIARLMKSLRTDNKHLALHTLRSVADYANLRTAIREELDERIALERSLICYDQPNFFLQGFCAACGMKSSFNTSFMYAYETSEDGRLIPNWREHLDCATCGFTNRIRAAIHVFYSHVKPATSDRIYLTEQSTALFRWLQERQPNLVGSEYFGNIASLGSHVRGLRNEDLTQLTFADETFDHVLSFDVLEHVNDDVAALKEIYRCLKFGGTVLFGAPFAKERPHKLIRARNDSDGNVQHLMAPEYHGNPVDPEGGALCYRYFAWDLVDDLRSIGFKDPRVLHYWSEDFVYLGVEQFLFMATK